MDDQYMDVEPESDNRSASIALVIFVVVLVLAVVVAIIAEMLRPHEWLQSLAPLIT